MVHNNRFNHIFNVQIVFNVQLYKSLSSWPTTPIPRATSPCQRPANFGTRPTTSQRVHNNMSHYCHRPSSIGQLLTHRPSALGPTWGSSHPPCILYSMLPHLKIQDLGVGVPHRSVAPPSHSFKQILIGRSYAASLALQWSFSGFYIIYLSRLLSR